MNREHKNGIEIIADERKRQIEFKGWSSGHDDEPGATSPNKLFYAVPEGLVTSNEVPEYAGLITCKTAFPKFRIVKRAPFLHKDKMNVKEMLFEKYYWMSLSLQERIRGLESRIKIMENDRPGGI